jgi:hypothetical protein
MRNKQLLCVLKNTLSLLGCPSRVMYYVGKTTDIFVPVCCNYILSKYLVGLNYRKFLFRTLC